MVGLTNFNMSSTNRSDWRVTILSPKIGHFSCIKKIFWCHFFFFYTILIYFVYLAKFGNFYPSQIEEQIEQKAAFWWVRMRKILKNLARFKKKYIFFLCFFTFSRCMGPPHDLLLRRNRRAATVKLARGPAPPSPLSYFVLLPERGAFKAILLLLYLPFRKICHFPGLKVECCWLKPSAGIFLVMECLLSCGGGFNVFVFPGIDWFAF